jgi:hypothetical protein
MMVPNVRRIREHEIETLFWGTLLRKIAGDDIEPLSPPQRLSGLRE